MSKYYDILSEVKEFDDLFDTTAGGIAPRTCIRIECSGFSREYPLTVYPSARLGICGDINFRDWEDKSFNVVELPDATAIHEVLS